MDTRIKKMIDMIAVKCFKNTLTWICVFVTLILCSLIYKSHVQHDYGIATSEELYTVEGTGFSGDIGNISGNDEPEENQENTNSEVKSKKKVLLYTYMRGGSTFLGKLFLQNTEAVYWFEHLDGFYQTEFAMRPSVKPLNIIYFTNHTKRPTTKEEAHAIASYHKHIYDCDYESVSMDLLTDSHNRRSSSMSLGRCGLSGKLTKTCRTSLTDYCSYNSKYPKKLAPNVELSFRNNCFNKIQTMKSGGVLADHEMQAFRSYTECHDRVKDKFQSECQFAIEKCNNAKIIALKAIRLSMELVEQTMLAVPDMYFIYYVRDPRGIISSRIGNSALLTYEPTVEAKLLCERMLFDFDIFTDLAHKFPKRVLFMKYEDLAKGPFENAKKVYRFINSTMPDNVLSWLKEATNATSNSGTFGTDKTNSTAAAIGWTISLNKQHKETITKQCLPVLSKLNYSLDGSI